MARHNYIVYVANPKGWQIDCPTMLGYFWGDDERAIHPAHIRELADGRYGVLLAGSKSEAIDALSDLESGGDWGDHDPPIYAMRKLTREEKEAVANG